ncbi:DUF4083 domain-containing protein [Peribacillus sp. NPDC097197]|uniref:DUF4083 domain-containing protein n=1 Tax=Peribacillus sp. NPDC097197 TaxID=3390615 RepID=UPI003D00594C
MIDKKGKGGFILNVNVGDILFQLMMFIVLFGMIFAVYFFVRNLVRKSRNSKAIEQKLDKVIELLEKEKRE